MPVIDIWKFNLDPVGNKDLDVYWSILSTEEKQKAQTFIKKSLQHSYVITRALVRKIISTYLNMDPLKVTFYYSKFGKPFIQSDPLYHFNLTHSENYGVCAICPSAGIGVDLECLRMNSRINILAELIMTPEEQFEFNNLPIACKREAFFQIWTRKEAFVKCLGKGLQYDFKDCHIGFSYSPVIFEKSDSGYKKIPWFIQDISVDENYKAAVVVAHNSNEFTLRYFNVPK